MTSYTMRPLLLVVLLLALAPVPWVAAQWQTPCSRSSHSQSPTRATNGGSFETAGIGERVDIPPFSYARAVAYGISSGAVGLATGLYLGSLRGIGEEGKEAGPLLGAAVGHSLMIPVGVWLSDQRRGSYGWAMLASLGIGAAEIAAFESTQTTPGDEKALLVAFAAQVVSSIIVERVTNRRVQSHQP